VRVLICYLDVELVENSHEGAFVMSLHSIANFIILVELPTEGPELNLVIIIIYVFKQHMSHIVLENMHGKHDGEKVDYFGLKTLPYIFMAIPSVLKLLFAHHNYVDYCLNKNFFL